MNIRFIETVICVAQLRNFRATADRLNISPAAISSRIATIENELGIRLFDRSTKDVTITREGEQFLEAATRIVGEYQKLVSDFSADQNGARGRIRLGTVASLAKTLVPRIIGMLAAEHSGLEVRLVTDSGWRLARMLDAGELEIVLGIYEDELPNVVAEPLFQMGMYWLSRPGMLDSSGPLTPADLLATPIVSTEIGTLNHRRIMSYLGLQDSDPATFHYSNSYSTTINLVEAGIGVSVLPPVMVQEQLRDGRLEVLNVHPKYPAMHYFILRQRNNAVPMSRLFMHATRRAAQEVAAQFSRDLITMAPSD